MIEPICHSGAASERWEPPRAVGTAVIIAVGDEQEEASAVDSGYFAAVADVGLVGLGILLAILGRLVMLGVRGTRAPGKDIAGSVLAWLSWSPSMRSTRSSFTGVPDARSCALLLVGVGIAVDSRTQKRAGPGPPVASELCAVRVALMALNAAGVSGVASLYVCALPWNRCGRRRVPGARAHARDDACAARMSSAPRSDRCSSGRASPAPEVRARCVSLLEQAIAPVAPTRTSSTTSTSADPSSRQAPVRAHVPRCRHLPSRQSRISRSGGDARKLRLQPWSLRRAAAVIAVSEFAKKRSCGQLRRATRAGSRSFTRARALSARPHGVARTSRQTARTCSSSATSRRARTCLSSSGRSIARMCPSTSCWRGARSMPWRQSSRKFVRAARARGFASSRSPPTPISTACIERRRRSCSRRCTKASGSRRSRPWAAAARAGERHPCTAGGLGIGRPAPAAHRGCVGRRDPSRRGRCRVARRPGGTRPADGVALLVGASGPRGLPGLRRVGAGGS